MIDYIKTPDIEYAIEIIRRDVPKPVVPPCRFPKWSNHPWRWRTPDGRAACPLGLHPKSTKATPYSIPGLLDRDYGAVFADWWDAQADVFAAVEAVWGSPPDWDRSQLRLFT